MRSARVDLPWSMWAMIEKFLMCCKVAYRVVVEPGNGEITPANAHVSVYRSAKKRMATFTLQGGRTSAAKTCRSARGFRSHTLPVA